jgi:hypothetical protein
MDCLEIEASGACRILTAYINLENLSAAFEQDICLRFAEPGPV